MNERVDCTRIQKDEIFEYFNYLRLMLKSIQVFNLIFLTKITNNYNSRLFILKQSFNKEI